MMIRTGEVRQTIASPLGLITRGVGHAVDGALELAIGPLDEGVAEVEDGHAGLGLDVLPAGFLARTDKVLWDEDLKSTQNVEQNSEGTPISTIEKLVYELSQYGFPPEKE